jgi:predicted Zn-dependent peptidase
MLAFPLPACPLLSSPPPPSHLGEKYVMTVFGVLSFADQGVYTHSYLPHVVRNLLYAVQTHSNLLYSVQTHSNLLYAVQTHSNLLCVVHTHSNLPYAVQTYV